MKAKKMVLSLVCAVFIFLFSITNLHAYSYMKFAEMTSQDQTALLQDNSGGFCVVGIEEENVKASYINSKCEQSSVTLTLQEKCVSYAVSNGAVYFANRIFLTDDNQNTVCQTGVTSYNFSTGRTNLQLYGDVSVANTRLFAVNDERVYMVGSENRTVLKAFSQKGGALFHITCPENILQLVYDRSVRTLFVVTSDAVYYLPDGSGTLNQCFGGVAADTVSAAGKGILTDGGGNVYRFKEGNLLKLFQVNTFSGNPNGAVVNNTAYFSYGGRIEGYSVTQGKLVRVANIGEHLDYLMPCGNVFGGYSEKSGTFYLLEQEDIALLPVEKPTDPNSGSSSTPVLPSGGSIKSSVYRIDDTNALITAIQASTTIAKFKSNLSYDGYKIAFKTYNGTVKTTGNVSTGMYVSFSDKNGYLRARYRTVVSGDVTGEGNMNSSDKRLVMQYLLGEVPIDYPFDLAADINRDGRIDTLDLFIIAKG